MYTGPHIITDNLVLSADAGSLRSYGSGSSIVNNPATPGYSGSLDNLDNTEIITYLVTACSINIDIFDKLALNFKRN